MKGVIKINHRNIFKFIISLLAFLSISTAVYAAIEETVKLTGVSFSVGTDFSEEPPTSGNTALKYLVSLTGGTSNSNLGDTVAGPSFQNLNAVWTQDVPVKLFNKGADTLQLTAKADYINDPDTLRDDIHVSIIEWNDADNDGVVDAGENGLVYGNDTILRLRNDTFVLGQVSANQVRGFIYRFSGEGLSEANAGQTASFDFTIVGASN